MGGGRWGERGDVGVCVWGGGGSFFSIAVFHSTFRLFWFFFVVVGFCVVVVVVCLFVLFCFVGFGVVVFWCVFFNYRTAISTMLLFHSQHSLTSFSVSVFPPPPPQKQLLQHSNTP